MSVDQEQLSPWMHRFVADLGATLGAGGVVLGDRLGLYRALATGPMGPAELARRTGTAPRYVEEWLRGQAAGGYVEYDPVTGAYFMSAEQASALADPDAPFFAPDAFRFALGALGGLPEVSQAFRTGEGIDRRHHHADLADGRERFLLTGHGADLVTRWLPALDGVEERLGHGGRVVDVPCGRGGWVRLMALAYPAATFVGWDDQPESIAAARDRAAQADLAGRARFEVGSAQTFDGDGYDLVTTVDALHHLGDPLGAARHIRERLAPDGTWLIVEPAAGASVSANLNPMGRIYYGLSTYVCVPHALAQEGGYSLGAQAGEEPVRRLVLDAGFRRFTRVADTPFSAVYAARPAGLE